MRRLFVLAASVVGIGALAVFVVGAATAGSPHKVPRLAQASVATGYILKGAATGQIRQPSIPIQVTQNGVTTTVNRPVPFLSGAAVTAEQQAICPQGPVPNCDERAAGADAGPSGNLGLDSSTAPVPGTLGCANRNADGSTRVNQDCTFRRQAEEEITYSASDPRNLVAGQNDSRVGFNQCGIDFSTNNGRLWGDMLPPFRTSLNDPQDAVPNTIGGDPGTFHTYDAASDPVNATDSRGRAFFSCVAFDVASNASGVFVTESPVGAKGAFYFNIPEIGNAFMPVQDNSPLIAHDKNWIAADHYVHSPNRDNVYVTWTVFKFGASCLGGSDTAPAFCESPIYGSMSTDNAHTWSAPEEISGASSLCFFGNFFNPALPANQCNNDQGSNPVVLPNGDLEVIYNNGNTAPGNPNGQQLGVHCKPSGDSVAGTAHLNCAAPVKVGDDVSSGEPLCDFGRGPEECIPGAYIRTNDFPRIVTENTQNNHLYAVWQDYRNGEFDIHMSQSFNGGLTWSDAGQVNPDNGLDHYMPAVDQSPQHGDRLGVSYYRTQRVPNENTTPKGGFAPCGNNGVVNTGASKTCQPGVGALKSDYVLAGGTGDQTPYRFVEVSPVFDPPDGIQSGFNGDYSGITINTGDQAHPIWSDTRNVNPFPPNGVIHDEDVFSLGVNLPGGRDKYGQGQIGK